MDRMTIHNYSIEVEFEKSSIDDTWPIIKNYCRAFGGRGFTNCLAYGPYLIWFHNDEPILIQDSNSIWVRLSPFRDSIMKFMAKHPLLAMMGATRK